jgi:hypothetical protein
LPEVGLFLGFDGEAVEGAAQGVAEGSTDEEGVGEA